MNLGRIFNEEYIAQGDGGRQVLAMKIACATCGAVAYFAHQNGRARKPPGAAKQNFQAKGWVVGSSPRKDFCPHHAVPSLRKGRADMSANGKTIDIAANLPVRADPPRLPSIDDRRIINLKLTECYADGGYVSPWTDQRVADDLNVPRAWVSEVREFSFGPEGSNPLLDEFLAAQQAFASDCRALSLSRVDLVSVAADADKRIKALQEDVQTQVKAACRKVADLAAEVRRRGDELDAKGRDLAALAKRVEREIGR